MGTLQISDNIEKETACPMVYTGSVQGSDQTNN